MTYTDVLTGDTLHTSDVERTAQMPLPSDNWYAADVSDDHRAWNTAPYSLFALVDDGASVRWIPVVNH